jgi:hypothetical protein
MTQIGNFIAVTDAKIARIFLDFNGSLTDAKGRLIGAKNLFLDLPVWWNRSPVWLNEEIVCTLLGLQC